jgi:hypothetical protein
MIDSTTAALGALVLVQGATALFWAGGTHAQIKALQKAVEPIANLKEDMVRVTERIDLLLERLDGEAARGRRRRGAGDAG